MLEELNENFWGKVILVNIQNSTGMGGWGCLWIVTSEARCYFIGFEGFPYNERKLEEFAPLFKKSTTYQYRFAAEEGGWWKYISNRKILIRKDFYDAFMKIYEEEDRWARGGYHYVHGHRCKHASEEREAEYIQKAIELGAEEIVFTDHAPFPGNPFNYRMAMDELKEYAETLQTIKYHYADLIEVKIGLEIEYVPLYFEHYRELKERWKIDILLLGQHFSLLPDGRYTFDLVNKSGEAYYLAQGIMEGMESGLFDVVAHPDQIFRRIKRWDSEASELAKQIKECAARTEVALEKNISNMFEKKRKHLYWHEFWLDVPDELKIIYGVYAHSVEEMEENYRRQQYLDI